MQEDWFPEVKADIFLSHSHKNEKLIISFACWLYENFRIKAFVDSSIWGYSNDLLKIIDNEYCIKSKDDFNTIYNYEKRNFSTSHVHMMLSMALAKMIDNTECLFFINTPESILVSDAIDENAELQIKYNVQLDHLINLNKNDLLQWWKLGRKNIYENPLDVLYVYKNLLPKQLNG